MTPDKELLTDFCKKNNLPLEIVDSYIRDKEKLEWVVTEFESVPDGGCKTNYVLDGDRYAHKQMRYTFTFDQLMNDRFGSVKSGTYFIKSVRYRNETFTVGEKTTSSFIKPAKIIKFEIDRDRMKVYRRYDDDPENGYGDFWNNISELSKLPPKPVPLFVTNGDGQEVFEGDEYFSIDINRPKWISKITALDTREKIYENNFYRIIYFKSRTAAESYLIENARVLSFQDYTNYLKSGCDLNIKDVVRQRLNLK